MGNGRFTLCAIDFSVQVTEAARRRVRQPQQHLRIKCGQLQVVVQRAVLVVISDEEELCKGTSALNVSRNEPCGKSQVKTELTDADNCRSRSYTRLILWPSPTVRFRHISYLDANMML